jgi:hypothetical protein
MGVERGTACDFGRCLSLLYRLLNLNVGLEMSTVDLNVSAPDHVPEMLLRAAQAYYASADELTSAWQDESAGAIWQDLAKILERAAAQCDKAIAKRGL